MLFCGTPVGQCFDEKGPQYQVHKSEDELDDIVNHM